MANVKKLLLCALLLLPMAAYAFSQQDAPTMTPDNLPLPKAVEGATPWQLFAATKEKQKKVTFPDGSYSFDVSPGFSDNMRALGGTEITLHGFMFPLEQSDKQSTFLFGPYPPSCPFHYHVGPNLVVEVHMKKPIAFAWDEVRLKGTLELLEKDPNGVFYKLNNAEMVR